LHALRAIGSRVAGRAGSVALIHVLVVHRAGPNHSDRNRSAIINEYKTMVTLDRWGRYRHRRREAEAGGCAFADLPLRRNRRPF
jgi:hypothetical protein